MLLYTNNSEDVWHREESGKIQIKQSEYPFLMHSEDFLKKKWIKYFHILYFPKIILKTNDRKIYQGKLPKAIILSDWDNKFDQLTKIKLLESQIYFHL